MRDILSVASFSFSGDEGLMDANIETVKKIAIALGVEEGDISLRSNGEIWCMNGDNRLELVALYYEGMIFEYLGEL